jgi:hypothetical protein
MPVPSSGLYGVLPYHFPAVCKEWENYRTSIERWSEACVGLYSSMNLLAEKHLMLEVATDLTASNVLRAVQELIKDVYFGFSLIVLLVMCAPAVPAPV